MLIFVEQQADRFSLGPGAGDRLHLAEDPAREAGDAERAGAGDQHVGKPDPWIERRAAEIEGHAEGAGEGGDPRDRGGRDRDEGDRRHRHAGHDTAHDQLDRGALGSEGIAGQGGPQPGEADRFGDGHPGGGKAGVAARSPGGGNHRASRRHPIGESDQGGPPDDPFERDRAIHRPGGDQRPDESGDAEKGGEQGPGADLAVMKMGLAQPLAGRVDGQRVQFLLERRRRRAHGFRVLRNRAVKHQRPRG
jgi:hypothetical protein